MSTSRNNDTDSTTSHEDKKRDVLTHLQEFLEKLKLESQKLHKTRALSDAAYNNFMLLCDEHIDRLNPNAQYHHILKSCHLLLQAIPKRKSFSENPAYQTFQKLILDELAQFAWCDSAGCKDQCLKSSKDDVLDNDNIITKSLNNLNVHSHITTHALKNLTKTQCKELLNKIHALAELFDRHTKPEFITFISSLDDSIPDTDEKVVLADCYQHILSAIANKLHRMKDEEHQHVIQLILELIFWDARRFDECSMPKENTEDSLSALADNTINLLRSRTSDSGPVNTTWDKFTKISGDTIRTEMNPHKLGAIVERHPELFDEFGATTDTTSTIKKSLITDFIAYFANPSSPYVETEKALRDLFYDPFVFNGEVRTKRKDAYYQFTKLNAFKYDDDSEALYKRLKPLLELKTAEDFQMLQAYLAIYPVESGFHGIDIPSDTRLLIICKEIKAYQNKHSDLTSSHFKWFVKHLRDYIYSDQLDRHMLDYILNIAPISVLSSDQFVLATPQSVALESDSNKNNQDQKLSSPRQSTIPHEAEDRPHGKGEAGQEDAHDAPARPSQEEKLRQLLVTKKARPLAPTSAKLESLNLKSKWSSYSHAKKVLIVTAIAVVLALALSALAAGLLYAGPVVPVLTAAGTIATINWATAVGTVGVVSILAGLPAVGAIIGFFAGIFISRKSIVPARHEPDHLSPQPISGNTTAANDRTQSARRPSAGASFFVQPNASDIENDAVPTALPSPGRN